MAGMTYGLCFWQPTLYAAVSVADGEFDALILLHVNSDCMQIFLDEISLRHIDECGYCLSSEGMISTINNH
jgi:hypothetical protein